MKKQLLITICAISGLSLSGCQWFLGPDVDPKKIKQVDNEPIQPPKDQNQQTKDQTSITEPVEQLDAGLKKPTDPEQFLQARQGRRGGADPFKLFSLPSEQSPEQIARLQRKQKQAEQQQQQVARLQRKQQAETQKQAEQQKQQRSDQQKSRQAGQQTPEQPGQTDKPRDGNEKGEIEQPEMPPKPKLAQGVQVLGAVQVGNDPMLIVKAPNEKTARYVRPGQFISNQQVLIKKINMNDQPTPTVVLQQRGFEKEVVKAVGKGVTVGTTQGIPTSSTSNQQMQDTVPSIQPQQPGQVPTLR